MKCNITLFGRFTRCLFNVFFVLITSSTICDAEVNSNSPIIGKHIHIDGMQYNVPLNWATYATQVTDVVPKDIALIPIEYSENNTEIHIRRDARDAIVKLLKSAGQDGVLITVRSGYRSIRFQKGIFKNRLAKGDSFEKIALSVAPPGYSQHHLGNTVDLVTSKLFFGNSAAYLWLKNNAASYCFYESYPKQGTQFNWEPWHWQYRPCKNQR